MSVERALFEATLACRELERALRPKPKLTYFTAATASTIQVIPVSNVVIRYA